MRRRGLRAHIRQQRRLAKRMATRHSMARRHQAGVRMLEMLGAWDDELSSTPRQFVPPAAPLAVTAAATVATSGEPPAPVDADDDVVEAIAPTVDRGDPARSVSAQGGGRISPVTDTPTHVSPNVSPDAPPRHAQLDAQGSSRRASDHPETHPRRIAHPAVPPATPQPGPQPVSRALASEKPAARAERRSPGVRETNEARDRVAVPAQAHPSPVVERASRDSRSPARDVDQATTPDTSLRGDVRVADTAAEIASSTPAPGRPASVERTLDDAAAARTSTEYDVVGRALAALRASGELASSPRPAPRRVAPPPEQPSAQQVAPLPAGDLTESPPNADTGQPTALVVRAPEMDPSAHDTAPPPPEPEHQTSPRAPVERVSEPGPSLSAPRIDERRQARRPPAHAAGHRPSAPPADTPAGSSQGPAMAARDRSERPPGEPGSTQFRFADSGRTPQEWRQLLIEATTPQSATPRARAPRPVVAPSQTQPPDTPRITRPGPPSRTVTAVPTPADATTDASRALRSARPSREARQPVGNPPTSPPPAPREHSPSTVQPAPDAREGVPHSVAPVVPPPALTTARDTDPAGAPGNRESVAQRSGDMPGTADREVTAPAPGRRPEAAPAPNGIEPAVIETAETADETTVSVFGDAPNVVAEEPRPVASARAATATPRLAPPAIPRSAPATTTPVPLSPSTRRFLRPLVGIDPDTVQVRRDDDATSFAAAHGADAVAVGDAVVLPADRDERDPATLALIAHELTHVARARSRRFVPPVARGEWTASAAGIPRASSVRGVDPERARAAPAPDDEELMARVVEARVREAATRERAVAVTTFVEGGRSPSPDDDIDGDTHLADGDNDAPATATSTPARPARWGGLPAPWEPLPDFMTRARTSTTPSPAVSPSPSPNDVAGAGASASPASVRLAERGLGSAGEEPAHAEPPASPDGDGAPDIDVLARQVYAVLRRRLAAERRRGA